ncbi:MAG TPA: hypothetical protein VIM73_17260, partial [Polyangiaceae bacterium]
ATALGIPGPVAFESAAADGNWAVLCQPRADTDGNGRLEVSVGPAGALGGDVLTRSLWFASGAEHPIDDLLARSDEDGGALALRDEKLLWFRQGVVAELAPPPGIDLRFEPGVRNGHRTLSLRGNQLFYARVAGVRSELVLRDLENGTESVEYSGIEPIVRFDLYESGALVVLRVGGVDSNGNGRFDWPYTPQSTPRPCEGPIPKLRAPHLGADTLGTVVLDRRARTARRVDDLVALYGASVIRRASDGTLAFDLLGRTRVFADKNCAGKILWADPARDQLLLGCATPKKPGRLLVDLLHGLSRQPLDIDVAALGDEAPAHARRLVALYPGADTVIVDLERRQLHRLRPGDAVLHVLGAHAVVRRTRSLYLFDVESATERALAEGVDPYGGVLVQGQLVYASPFVVDAAAGLVLGRVPGPGYALTPLGAVLVPEAPASAALLARGPLRWRAPATGEHSESD